MTNEFEAKEAIISLLDNSALTQVQMNLAIKEVVEYYNLEGYMLKQLDRDARISHLTSKCDDLVRYISDLDEDFRKEDVRNNELTDKVTELELGIKVLEGELDAAQEKIEEICLDNKTLELDVLTRANYIIEIASDLSETQHLLQLMTEDRDSAASSFSHTLEERNEIQEKLDDAINGLKEIKWEVEHGDDGCRSAIKEILERTLDN